MYIGNIYAMLMYADIMAIIRFVQVCVWKRVMEINEDLAEKCLNKSVIGINLFLGLLCHPEYKQYAIISVFSGKLAEMPMAACKDDIDPLHQK